MVHANLHVQDLHAELARQLYANVSDEKMVVAMVTMEYILTGVTKQRGCKSRP